MDDGVFLVKTPNIKYFSMCLNNLHPTIKYSLEKGKSIQSDHSQLHEVLNHLDIEVILHSSNTVKTDICYIDTNTHDCLPYNSAHPKHCKDSLPYNLVKYIDLFLMIKRLR